MLASFTWPAQWERSFLNICTKTTTEPAGDTDMAGGQLDASPPMETPRNVTSAKPQSELGFRSEASREGDRLKSNQTRSSCPRKGACSQNKAG